MSFSLPTYNAKFTTIYILQLFHFNNQKVCDAFSLGALRYYTFCNYQ